ncbi:acyl-CoA carboxylase epsilon subunit [Streptomyces sp. DG2A-72]|uniref:acyl-CoA carboxylase epsilon subunit n=1 Tax=Streptomyces sp. DG2A-72 TaxID=3051386 RepID=UPI00265C46C6|nr:acyl-CoA carboxylase epsilon subunit [Streptomyces sp. DG2A-72]MDO0930203.1 acyl-CoA carboxylase epsilon subunit [Streptomyces sp. DG2A-72]MDO0939215.1 acyl-CoA carboxylase epsilon subunit [Streptomyces sp. DG2A-72]MDO0939457.1 acyl-CoA carboxylase epsilon subunit [Streptomyces sp. DG2A-72]
MDGREVLIRVERGRPDEAELAAVVAVLLAVRAPARQAPGQPPVAGMRWWRTPDAYAAPDGWH